MGLLISACLARNKGQWNQCNFLLSKQWGKWGDSTHKPDATADFGCLGHTATEWRHCEWGARPPSMVRSKKPISIPSSSFLKQAGEVLSWCSPNATTITTPSITASGKRAQVEGTEKRDLGDQCPAGEGQGNRQVLLGGEEQVGNPTPADGVQLILCLWGLSWVFLMSGTS